MPNSTTSLQSTAASSAATDKLSPLLIPAAVAGPMCGRSEASWWRDHAAGRVPTPAAKFPGRTLWSVEELRSWVSAGCPVRQVWDALRRANGGVR